MKELNKREKGLVLLFVLLIAVSLLAMLYLTMFHSNEYSISYSSGCIEKYRDNTIIEGNCSLERGIMNYYMSKQNKSRYFYLERLEVKNE